MRYSKKNIKEAIKGIGKKAIIKGCRVGIVNDDIEVALDLALGKAESLIINGKKHKTDHNSVRIPYSDKTLEQLLRKGISANLELGKRKRRVAVSKKLLRTEGEKLVIGSRQYPLNCNALVKLSDLRISSREISFRPVIVAGSFDKLTFALLDVGFKNKAEAEWRSDSDDFVKLKYDQMPADKDLMQLAALNNEEAVPLIMGIGQSPAGFIVSQLNNRICFEKERPDSYIFKTAGKIDSKAFAAKSKKVNFDLDYEKEGLCLVVESKKADSVILAWQDLRTGKETEIAVIDSSKSHRVDLVSEMNRELAPCERYALRYKTIEKGKITESGFAFVEMLKKRLYSDNVMLSDRGNSIIRTGNKVLVLERTDSYLSYQDKYSYSFSTCGFTAHAKNVRFEGESLCFDLSLQSTLLRLSSAEIYVKDNYRKTAQFIDDVIFDSPAMRKEFSVRVDLGAFGEVRYNNMRLSLCVGVRYANGYAEEDLICAKPEKLTVRERYLCEHTEDGMVTSAYLGENHLNLNLWYTSEEEFLRGVNYQEGREAYFITEKNEDIDNHLILFEANLGKNYTGNPKYLYEYMISHPEYSNFKYVWAYPNRDICPIPGDPVIVERGSAEYFRYLAKAKYRINNIRFPLPNKRDGSVYLNTWHGTPLKKLGFDIECDGPEKQAFGSLYKESQTWDYMTVDNDYGEEKLVGAFRFEGTVIKKGYPINDIFYDEERKKRVCERIEKEYPVIKGKKVILYAPTWRDLKGDYVRGYEFSLPFSIQNLYEAFGDEYVIIVKLHHLIADNLVIDDKYKDFLINASNEEDIMELLCKTDILITDYSSVFYDFASAHKPILFYMYDLEEYLNETRGTYISVFDLPGPIIKEEKGLIESIRSIRDGSYGYTDKLESFCREFSKYCKGTSSRDVLEIVIDKEDLK